MLWRGFSVARHCHRPYGPRRTAKLPPNLMNSSSSPLRFSFLAFGICLLAGCSSITASEAGPDYQVSKVEHGKASFYSTRCNGGTHTASGETLRNDALTAAHKSLPMGTKVRVINLDNGKSEIVTINDRGPYIRGRIIDVTIGVAKRLDFIRDGVVSVKVEILEDTNVAQAS